MNSNIDICNSALTKVGASLINSFADGTPTANICAARYDACRQSVLRSHIWNCATKRVVLAALTSTPAYGTAVQFQLPADCLRAYQVNDFFRDDWWRVEGRLLLVTDVYTSESSVNLKYIYDLQAVGTMDILLAEAIAAHLAWDISFKLTQSLQLKQELATELKLAISRAKLADSQESSVRVLTADTILDARLASTTGTDIDNNTLDDAPYGTPASSFPNG